MSEAAGLTILDLQDDDALRFACRVLDGENPCAEDRQRARDMLMAIRVRMRRPAAPQSSPPHTESEEPI